MPTFKLYHNPACSKSRAALELLGSRGIVPELVLYLDTPPGREAIVGLLAQLGLPASALIRQDEALYRELGLGEPGVSEQALIDAMAAHPVLIQRPVLVCGERAVIGRPAQAILALLPNPLQPGEQSR